MNRLISIKKDKLHIVISLFGLKIKFKDSKKVFQEFKDLQQTMRRLSIPTIYTYEMNTKQKIWYLSDKYYKEVGVFPDFYNPKTFNEKLNWMKLNYYNPNEKQIIDKCEFKNYIKNKIGEEYVIPLIAVYDNVNQINFDVLPDKFVIKTTTSGGSTGVQVIKDKNKIDINALKYKFNTLLQEWNTIYYYSFSRGYKDIPPRLIIEEYIEQKNSTVLTDYKFFCFNGEVAMIELITNRKDGNFKASFYDCNWKQIHLKSGSHKLSKEKQPKNFNKMLELAQILSKDFPFVRVDMYNINGRIYIGEMTFTPASGFMKFNPIKWDYKLGELLKLEELPKEYINILPEFEKL